MKIYFAKTESAEKHTTKKISRYPISSILIIIMMLSMLATGCQKKDGTDTKTNPATDSVPAKSADEVAEVLKELGDEYGYTNALSELTEKTTSTIDGDTYYRLQQNYQGIPVYGRTVIYAVDEHGTVLAITGNALDIDTGIDLTPTITQEQALNALTEYANNYLTSSSSQVSLLQDLSDKDLCIYTSEESTDCLAYDTYMCYEEILYHVVLSATTDDIFLCTPTTLNDGESVKASGKNIDGENVSFQAYKRGENDYIMWDSGRNLLLYDANNEYLKRYFTGTSEDGKRYTCRRQDGTWYDEEWNPVEPPESLLIDSLEWRFLTEENKKGVNICASTTPVWDNKQAVTVITRAAQTYDFYQEILNRTGYDNNNAMLTIVVKNKEAKSRSAYSSTPYPGIPLSMLSFYKKMSLDTIAHEYTHSVEASASGMTYQGESGAIMEALSDIFGELVEDWADGSVEDWADGSCDWIHDNGRNLCAPSKSSSPSVYQGKNWKETDVRKDNDNGNVHNNSTVISHAAYLMWNGIDGDSNKKLTTEQLAKLWYRAMLMMPSDCDFAQCRTLVELAAESVDLTDKQARCVSEAFDAVGISGGRTVEYTISTEAALCVYDTNGNLYDNYSYHVVGLRSTVLSSVTTNPEKPYEETQTISSAEPHKLSLAEGYYVIRLLDNSDAPQPYSFTVQVVNSGGEEQLDIYTGFGTKLDPSALYLEVLNEKMVSTGYTEIDSTFWAKNEYRGLLHDMDQDGCDELFLWYLDESYAYKFEIWGITNGKTEMLHSETLVYAAGGNQAMLFSDAVNGVPSVVVYKAYGDTFNWTNEWIVYTLVDQSLETVHHATKNYNVDSTNAANTPWEELPETITCILDDVTISENDFTTLQWVENTGTLLYSAMYQDDSPDRSYEFDELAVLLGGNAAVPDEAKEPSVSATVDTAYDAFLANKDYLKDWGDISWNNAPSSYCIQDLNQDGTPELIVDELTFNGYHYAKLFTFDTAGKQVVFVSDWYYFNALYYSSKYNAVYANSYSSTMGGSHVPFCQIQGAELVELFTLEEAFSGAGYAYAAGGELSVTSRYKDGLEISEDEFNTYFDDSASLEFSSLN